MDNQQKIKQEKRIRRHQRVRAKVKGVDTKPRLSVFRSSEQIYVQLINDANGCTLAAADSREIIKTEDKKNELKGKIAKAFEVGKLIAEKALKNGIDQVVFDRGGYKYHGRVKALADGAREGGLKF
ncbi:MAG: 50S ribosomal protein L18 [Patescibacteria group bacterium]